jgi:LmbE family N-acetylglucosaminyl deacetylase
MAKKRRMPSTSAAAVQQLKAAEASGMSWSTGPIAMAEVDRADSWPDQVLERRLLLSNSAEEVSRIIIAATSRFDAARAALAAHRIAVLTHATFDLDRKILPGVPGEFPHGWRTRRTRPARSMQSRGTCRF